MKHYDFEISLYVDNELDEEMQRDMFEHIAVCGQCSKVLQDYINIKHGICTHYAAIPADTIVLAPASKERKTAVNKWAYAVAACVLIMLSFFAGNYLNSGTAVKEYDTKIAELRRENLLLNGRLNSQAKTLDIVNPVKTIKVKTALPRVIRHKKDIEKTNNIERNSIIDKRYTAGAVYSNVVQAKITETDYLTKKLTGN
jgi:hypothetical protein